MGSGHGFFLVRRDVSSVGKFNAHLLTVKDPGTKKVVERMGPSLLLYD